MPSSSGPISSGFITPSQADILNAALNELASLRQTLNNSDLNQAYTLPVNWQIFRAKLTAYDESSGYFDWIEQYFEGTAGGEPIDKPFGRFGTYLKSPASLMPGLTAPTVSEEEPVQCVILEKGFTGFGTLEYEIIYIPPTSSAPCTMITRTFVEKICPTVTKNSGVVTDVTFSIQHGVYQVCAEQLYDSTCNGGDTDCCPIPTTCCPDTPISEHLVVTITATDDYAAYDGLKICYQYSADATASFGVPTWTPFAASIPISGRYFAPTLPATWNYALFFDQTGSGFNPQRLWAGVISCGFGGWYGNNPLASGTGPLLVYQISCNSGTRNRTVSDGMGSNGIGFDFLSITCEPFFIPSNVGNVVSSSCSPSDPTGAMSYTVAEGEPEGNCSYYFCSYCEAVCIDPTTYWIVNLEGLPVMSCRDPSSFGGGCAYSEQDPSVFAGWALFFLAGTWTLWNQGTIFLYSMAEADFNCAGPNTFTAGGLPDVTIYF